MGWITFKGRHVFLPDATKGSPTHPVTGAKTPGEHAAIVRGNSATSTKNGGEQAKKASTIAEHRQAEEHHKAEAAKGGPEAAAHLDTASSHRHAASLLERSVEMEKSNNMGDRNAPTQRERTTARNSANAASQAARESSSEFTTSEPAPTAKGTPVSHQDLKQGDVVSFTRQGSAGSKHSFTTQDARHERVTVTKVEPHYVYTRQKGSTTAVDAHFRTDMANIIRH